MVKMGIFNSLAIFLHPLSILWWSTQSFDVHQNYCIFFGFTHCDGWL